VGALAGFWAHDGEFKVKRDFGCILTKKALISRDAAIAEELDTLLHSLK
jgi:hypothetical protein